MCGISGFFNTKDAKFDWAGSLERMNTALHHRGPDQAGVWMDREAGMALAHRRLSILDLSQEGNQPMISSSGRYVIVFNGEIYNFPALRESLPSHRWRGHSDTEVILEAIEHWGVRPAVEKFIGMFAIAIWDKRDRQLHLVRDRLGIKPLYYGWQGDSFLFGSELKALKQHPDFNNRINRNALALFLRYYNIPAPHSIYEGIFKLPPGHLLTVDTQKPKAELDPVPYWSAKDVAERGVAEPFEGSDQEAIAHMDSLLRDAVKIRMISDVPLGAFLSGGIDSSIVVALMQAQSSIPVKTFSIGFWEENYNEARHAKDVAQHLGTDHTELYVTPEQAMAVIPRLPTLYDEPFSDSSQIPTYLVSELARQKVTVSLSGDGGDELFGGYGRYSFGNSIWNKIKILPPWSRTLIAGFLRSISPNNWNRISAPFRPLLPSNIKPGNLGQNIHSLSEFLEAGSQREIYRRLVSHWKEPASVVIDGYEPTTHHTNGSHSDKLPDYILEMMLMDTLTYLPDDILTKVDRASMGVSLEARVPLLDHRVVEAAWKMPMHMKVRNGESKWLLKQILYQYVPREYIDRPKMGFGVPIDSWLRGPLREWAEELLDEKRLLREGYLNPAPIREKWQEHLTGKKDFHFYLWDILMFQAWLEEQGASR